MPRYTIDWPAYPARQRDELPGRGRRALDRLLDLLAANPRRDGVYDQDTDQWTAVFGAHGLLLYRVDEEWVSVRILRVAWSG